jgi:hypothetical protein
MNRDTVLFVAYALATAAMSVCAAHGWVSDTDALEIQGVLTAFATAFHIPNAKAAAALKTQDQAVTPSVTVVAEQSGPSANMAG